MLVKELIEKLKKCNPEYKVIYYDDIGNQLVEEVNEVKGRKEVELY
jgi:hypothetical protein